jgi:hypothetical protein
MPKKRECPNCRITLTRYQWSKLWWMSSLMSGRLVQPCAECGAKLRLSSMTLVSSAAALGLILSAIFYLMYQSPLFLFGAVALLLVILFATMATRLEVAPSLTLETTLDPKPERVGKVSAL